jgi:hypothetical protein
MSPSLNDLDRCEHGRHSVDHCFDCPGGHSTGNLFLATPSADPQCATEGQEIRIGTTVHGEPIVVTPIRTLPTETEQP